MSHPYPQVQDNRFRFSPTPIRSLENTPQNQRRTRYRSVPPPKSYTPMRLIAITTIMMINRNQPDPSSE